MYSKTVGRMLDTRAGSRLKGGSSLFKKKVKRQTLINSEIKYDYEFSPVEMIIYGMYMGVLDNWISHIWRTNMFNSYILGPKAFKWKDDTKFYIFNIHTKPKTIQHTFILPVELASQYSKDRMFVCSISVSLSFWFTLDGCIKTFNPFLIRNSLFSNEEWTPIRSLFEKNRIDKRNWCISYLPSRFIPQSNILHTQLLMRNIDFSAYDAEFNFAENAYKSSSVLNQNQGKIHVPGFTLRDWEELFDEVRINPICICPLCRKKYHRLIVRFFPEGNILDPIDII